MQIPRYAWDWVPKRTRRRLWDTLITSKRQQDRLRHLLRIGQIDVARKNAPVVERLACYHWFQSIDLGNGVTTPGIKSLDQITLEAKYLFDHVDLKGKSLLDIGACNGAFCIEAKRRGCQRVVAADVWRYPLMGTRETIDLAANALGLYIETMFLDIEKPLPTSLKPFDIVLFAGAFYHLKDPLEALSRAASLARDALIVETHIITDIERPAMVYYPGEELDGDASNWWSPNVACMEGLLRDRGFPRVNVSFTSSHRAIFHSYRAT